MLQQAYLPVVLLVQFDGVQIPIAAQQIETTASTVQIMQVDALDLQVAAHLSPLHYAHVEHVDAVL